MIYQQVIDLLAQTRSEISSLLNRKEDEHHRLHLESTLNRAIKYLAYLTGSSAEDSDVQPLNLGPAQTIAGKPIPKKETVSRAQLEPNQEKVQVLRDKVERMYAEFMNIPSLDILRNYEHTVIRGVAKKAKMKVTAEEPETIDLDFIEEIKTNIIEMEKRNENNQQLKKAAENQEKEIKSGTPEADEFYGTANASVSGDVALYGSQEKQGDIKNPADEEIQKGTQADVNDKGAAAAEDLPSPSEIREATTSTPDVGKASTSEIEKELDEVRPEAEPPKKTGRRNQ